ncbi:hypothetical protein BAE44_0003123 [Dichanthelium oligosanthes]|uniref:Mitochondrial import receptor subunit TOM9-2 n=1 Tax=Dichanthelium oligosanthes TaxID=888268 RepID=A0A1E5WF04_9POAL|nr:hypothetical protein BAE44_0003123 [Dichanthelium oligosanthes]
MGMKEEMSAFLDSLSQSPAAARGQEVVAMARKLARSVGKAAWYAGTTFLVLGIPLIIALEREMAFDEMEFNQQAQLAEMNTLLGNTPSYPPL